MDQAVFYGILIPFLGTSLGAACVFFMKHDMSERLSRILTGFAAGVMVAASIWSLLIPAMDQSEEMGKFAFIPAAAGFWGGILFLLLLDHIIPHLHRYSVSAEGPKSRVTVFTSDLIDLFLAAFVSVTKILFFADLMLANLYTSNFL